jgi:hypothetical protein
LHRLVTKKATSSVTIRILKVIPSSIVLALALASARSLGAQSVAPDEARAIAREAYIYGYPIVDSYRILYSYFVDKSSPEYKAGWNQKVFNNARVFTPADTAMQTPNSDTPYSQLGLDLRTEPMVLSMPAVEKRRYYTAEVNDLYTFIAGYIGSRTTGNDAGNFLIAGPDWKGEKPDGIEAVITCETQLAFVFYRTQLFRPDDLENVKRIQAGYKVQPLSAFLGKPAPSPSRPIDWFKPIAVEEEKTSLEYFKELNFVLGFCPTHPAEQELMARFAKLNIGRGKTFDANAFSPEVRQAIQAGMNDAWQAYKAEQKKMETGELTSADILGSRDFLKDNYLHRMMGTVDGIWGNTKEEAIYPGYYTDSSGQPLNGSGNRYTLRFAKDELPPVNAFWSLTMYNSPAHLLVENPIKRYLINCPMLPDLKRDQDGGLTIYIQHDSPGKEKESNWLPAPDGPFLIALRMYWQSRKLGVASGRNLRSSGCEKE